MFQSKHKFKSFKNIEAVEDISLESAATISGGGVKPTDVILFAESAGKLYQFGSNKKIENLAEYGFNDATSVIAITNDKTWRFYEDANFLGNYIDVAPGQAIDAGDFGLQISSFQAIT